MGFLKGIRRKLLLKRLMKRLASSSNEVKDEECLVQVGDQLAALREQEKRNAEGEMYAYIHEDAELRALLESYQVKEETLKNMYQALCLYGASEWVAQWYVPVAALTHVDSLKIILERLHDFDGQNEHRFWVETAQDVVRYFKSHGEGDPR